MNRKRGLILCVFYLLYQFISTVVILQLSFKLNGVEQMMNKVIYYTLFFDLLITILVIGLNIDLFIRWFKEFKWHYIFWPILGYVWYIVLSSVGLLLLPEPPEVSENQKLLEELFSPLSGYFLILKLAFIPAIIEELVFRVGIFGLISGKSNNKILLFVSFMVSACIFGGLHVSSEIQNLLNGSTTFLAVIGSSYQYFLMGFIMSAMYLFSRQNGLVNIGFHFLNNFIAVIVMIMYL